MTRSSLLSLALVLLACGDDASSGGAGASGGGDGGGSDPMGGAPAGGDNAGGASGGSTVDGGAGTGGGSCIDTSGLEYGPGPTNEPGCLTTESANTFCGFGSDEVICNFAVSCGMTKNLGQCQINCEQGSSSFCNDEAAVDCVVSAVCSDDCDALAACTFIL
jgi:hypothetical protein